MHVGSISVRPSPPFALGAFLRETQIVPGQPLDYFAIEETRLRLLKLSRKMVTRGSKLRNA